MTAIKMGVKKGDEVEIIAGNSKGQRGKLLRVFPKTGFVVVDNVNVRMKKVRGTDGKVVRAEQACPIHRSNVKKVAD